MADAGSEDPPQPEADALADQRADHDGHPEQDGLLRRGDRGGRDDDDRVARDDEADQDARLEQHREPGDKRPHERVDALHGVEQPREELVHAPSLSRMARPYSGFVPQPLVALPLPGWIDPARAFAGGPGTAESAFWLDAGPGAVTGWSWIGTGVRAPDADADAIRALHCAPAEPSSDDWAAGPFRGGWIGWLGYEDAAARAGAPVAASADPVPQELWLRVDRFVAFDHAGQARVGGRPGGRRRQVRGRGRHVGDGQRPGAAASDALVRRRPPLARRVRAAHRAMP